MPPGWWPCAAVLCGPPPDGMDARRWQRMYLTNLDWLLMTYSTVVGFNYALGYYREAQARGVREAQLRRAWRRRG